jgi:hypothetical protein
VSAWRCVAATLLIATIACAGYAVPVPDHVRGYEIVVEGRDSLSLAFAQALAQEGLRVRSAPRGGSRPAAVLVHFAFRESRDGPALLYARLTDTRTGRTVAAAAQPLDSTLAIRARAAALVRALVTSIP